ncbi:hypothetical protein [Bacillus massilinigeriensis]|uniref:hypothetical protein n=1 Tax=Bacillus massilionigeriensis TaxID=1805475 RepID=UPI00096ADDCB|nr:hypothetical protein [Bacillus massilionigeriensis]
MNITTIIEMENREVEQMAGAKMVFVEEKIMEDVVETCVNGFQSEESGKTLDTEDAMQVVFEKLKNEGVIPQNVTDFSYEMPSCGRIKTNGNNSEIPQKVIISFVA